MLGRSWQLIVPASTRRRAAWAAKAAWAARLGRLGRSPRPPGMQKSTEKIARLAARRRFRWFWEDLRVDFRRFPRLRRASESIRSAKSRTSVFASRRSTSEGSPSFCEHPKSKELVENSHQKRFAIMLHEKYSIF